MKFVNSSSSSSTVLVNSQLTQDHKQLQHLNSLTICLTLQCMLLDNKAYRLKTTDFPVIYSISWTALRSNWMYLMI